MAGIDIELDFMGGGQTGSLFSCHLHAENFQIMQTREPSIVALPMQNADNRGHVGAQSPPSGTPKNIAMDFGMMQEQVRIAGKIADEDQSDVNNRLDIFMGSFRTNWVQSPTVIVGGPDPQHNINSGGMIKVIVNTISGVRLTWGCLCIRASFTRPAGVSWWEYDLLLGVVFYPEQGYEN